MLSARDRSQPSVQPSTVIGLFLRATVLGQADERRRLTPQLNGGQRGWNYDEAAVAQAACELAASKYFGTDYDLGKVSEAISFLREVNIAKGTATPPQKEMEAVVRSALGDTNISLSDITPPVAFITHGALATYVVQKLGWSEPQVVGLIRRAEKVAFDRGWNPPLIL
jgi:hypothetical protein